MKQAFVFAIVFLSFSVFGLNGQEFNEIQDNIVEAKANNDSLNLSRAYYKMGVYYSNHDEYLKCKEYLFKAVYYAKALNNLKAVAIISNDIAVNFSEMGIKDSAFFYYEQSKKACISNNDSIRLASILINIGDEYASEGDFANASSRSLEALKIKELLNDSTNLAFYYQKIGEIYKMAGEKGKWEEYIHQAYQLINCDDCAGTSAIAAIYNDLGGIAEYKNNYDKALLYYDTLISFGKQHDYKKAVNVALTNSATIYKLKGNYNKAIELIEESNNYSDQSAYHNIYSQNMLSGLYLETNRLEEARKRALEVINNEKISNYPGEKKTAFKNLYLIEKKSNNFKNALAWNEKFKLLSDSARDENVRTRILELELAYQTEKKEHQIETLTQENKLKNQRLNAGIILLVVLVFIIFLILYILRIRKQKAKLIQNNLQQQVLQAQMNPHFIFNVMGSIQNYMQKNDTVNAARYLAKFSSLMRSTLEFSSENKISLSDEIKMLTDYIEIERMRVANKFDYKIITSENLESEFIYIPPMLVQPFIENAIKHGLAKLNRPGLLTLKITDKGSSVEFVIEDNGKGMDKNDQPQEHRPMAITIFEKRRKLMQQKYRRDFNFEIKNLKDLNQKKSGVQIIINIPILNND